MKFLPPLALCLLALSCSSTEKVEWVDYGDDPMLNPQYMEDMTAAGTPGPQHEGGIALRGCGTLRNIGSDRPPARCAGRVGWAAARHALLSTLAVGKPRTTAPFCAQCMRRPPPSLSAWPASTVYRELRSGGVTGGGPTQVGSRAQVLRLGAPPLARSLPPAGGWEGRQACTLRMACGVA